MKSEYHCYTCGKPVLRQPGDVVGRVFCSRAHVADAIRGQPSKRRLMVGPVASGWAGGSFVKAGYRLIWEPTHPNADPQGYVAEHRKVVADSLGRALEDGEHVHHRNLNKLDNRLANLVILSPSEHALHHRAMERAVQGWSRLYERCLDCGTQDRKHFGQGLCTNCYHRGEMARKRAAGYIAPSRRR